MEECGSTRVVLRHAQDIGKQEKVLDDLEKTYFYCGSVDELDSIGAEGKRQVLEDVQWAETAGQDPASVTRFMSTVFFCAGIPFDVDDVGPYRHRVYGDVGAEMSFNDSSIKVWSNDCSLSAQRNFM